ncbi:ABC transporter permease [bacterium]|nr:ABC transporter permease [bacterium]
MNGPVDVSIAGLFAAVVLLVIPLALSLYLKLGLTKSILISTGRMGIQLTLMAFYLTYLFELDNHLVNISWMLVMLSVAAGTVIKRSGLNYKLFALPLFISLVCTVIPMLYYFNKLILGLDGVFAARYFLVIGGMLLGNSLRGNVIALSNYYQAIKRNELRYLSHICLGASVTEACAPYLRQAIKAALNPSIASMATMGIVWLPGMMTGQMLGGASPMTAIKYQVVIMLAIFVLACSTIIISIFLTMRKSFDGYGRLRENVLTQK